MGLSDWINIGVSIVSLVIATVAIIQTHRQIALSNKQQLFERRLERYIEISKLLRLLKDNIIYLKDDSSFYHTNDLIFAWLTNCSELADMGAALADPLQSDKQKQLLTIHERLKKSAVEIKMIFSMDLGETMGNFVDLYADLLQEMYQMQIFISKSDESKKMFDRVPTLEEHEKKCKDMANGLGLFKNRDQIIELYDLIEKKNYLGEMEEKLRLVR